MTEKRCEECGHWKPDDLSSFKGFCEIKKKSTFESHSCGSWRTKDLMSAWEQLKAFVGLQYQTDLRSYGERLRTDAFAKQQYFLGSWQALVKVLGKMEELEAA